MICSAQALKHIADVLEKYNPFGLIDNFGPEHEPRMVKCLQDVEAARVIVVEAMMLQALKQKVKATGRDLVTTQIAQMAADNISEDKVHPVLLSCGKNLLK